MNAELDLLGLLAGTLERFGLRPGDVTIRLSHRDAAASVLQSLGVHEDQLHETFTLLDRKEKMPPEVFATKAQPLGLGPDEIAKLDAVLSSSGTTDALGEDHDWLGTSNRGLAPLFDLAAPLRDAGLEEWVTFDPGIVRGLAYYTGTVFEVHECRGAERAIAGGGRYDELIELLGGPKTPACGFAMGDVVLGLVLENLDRLPESTAILPRPDCFVIDAGGRPDAVRQLLRALRGGRPARANQREGHPERGQTAGRGLQNRARFAAILVRKALMAQSNSKIWRAANNEPWLPVNWPRYWPRQPHPISHLIQPPAPEWSSPHGVRILDPYADSNQMGVIALLEWDQTTPLEHHR